MDIEKIFQDHNEKAQRFVALQSTGMSIMEATYKVYGTEVGDQMIKLKQSEMNIKPNLQ